jgi:hypothetical protein
VTPLELGLLRDYFAPHEIGGLFWVLDLIGIYIFTLLIYTPFSSPLWRQGNMGLGLRQGVAPDPASPAAAKYLAAGCWAPHLAKLAAP